MCIPSLEHSSHSVPFLHSYILLFSIPFHRENPMPQIQARDLPRESGNMVFYKRGGPVRIYLLLFFNSALKSWADKVFSRFNSVQLLSCVWIFATPWTAACQASLSIANSQSLLKLMPIELVMPSNHLILCRPLLLPLSVFPSIGSFLMSQFFASGGQSIGVSASASVLQMNIQDWSPLGWTGLISLWCKGLSRVFFNTTVQKQPFFNAQLSL